jgi:hypothetical protein
MESERKKKESGTLTNDIVIRVRRAAAKHLRSLLSSKCLQISRNLPSALLCSEPCSANSRFLFPDAQRQTMDASNPIPSRLWRYAKDLDAYSQEPNSKSRHYNRYSIIGGCQTRSWLRFRVVVPSSLDTRFGLLLSSYWDRQITAYAPSNDFAVAGSLIGSRPRSGRSVVVAAVLAAVSDELKHLESWL